VCPARAARAPQSQLDCQPGPDWLLARLFTEEEEEAIAAALETIAFHSWSNHVTSNYNQNQNRGLDMVWFGYD